MLGHNPSECEITRGIYIFYQVSKDTLSLQIFFYFQFTKRTEQCLLSILEMKENIFVRFFLVKISLYRETFFGKLDQELKWFISVLINLKGK